MPRIVRVLAFILGASWFFPISCTSGLIAGTFLMAAADERHIEKGDPPHALFFVVWQPGEAGAPFGYSRLAELSQNPTPAAARSFIMTQASARIGENEFTGIEYKVLASGQSQQLIEVTWSDGDSDSVSRYRATPAGVTPVYSRIMGRQFMFKALPLAAGFAAAIFATGWWLRRRVARNRAANDGATSLGSRG
jgi:hypothetical protein